MASGDDRGSGRLIAAPASASMALGMERPMSAQTPASSLIAGLQQGQHPFMTASARPEVRDVAPLPRDTPVSCVGELPAPCWKPFCHTARVPHAHPTSSVRSWARGASANSLTQAICLVIRRTARSSCWTAGTC